MPEQKVWGKKKQPEKRKIKVKSLGINARSKD